MRNHRHLANWKSLHKYLWARVLRSTRELEIELILEAVTPYLKGEQTNLKLLEFGAGNCYQAKRLSRLGAVTATETDFMELRGKGKGPLNLIVSRLEESPFKSHSFDVVFSNHVLEHLSDLSHALKEALRIAKEDALFIFTVPTRFWLLLAQPAEMGWRIAGLRTSWRREGASTFAKLFKLASHGEYRTFGECFNAFGVWNWTKLLEANGFQVLKRLPLLAYAPSELLLPPSRTLVRFGLCSSLLFVLKRSKSLNAPGNHSLSD